MEALLDLVMSLRMCPALQHGAFKPADGFIQIIHSQGGSGSALPALILQLKVELSVKAWDDFVSCSFSLSAAVWSEVPGALLKFPHKY